MAEVDLKSISLAEHHLKDVAIHTPLTINEDLSNEFSCNVYLKREDLQRTRSYKLRGAYNFVYQRSKEGEKGFVCASAGNHSQGFAYACNRLGIMGYIFMPTTTSSHKIEKTRKFGGKNVEIIIEGDTFDDACRKAQEFGKAEGKLFVHPFDDPYVISGQGTVGMEILYDLKDIDYIFVPIGGGGLIAGVGTYTKSVSPRTKILGVEPCGAPSMHESLKQGHVVTLESIDSFVDGAAVKRVGDLTFEIARKVIDDIVLVPEGKVSSEIRRLLYDDAIIAEPAGALSTAALDFARNTKYDLAGKNIVCIVSGGNFDFKKLPNIEKRSLMYEGLKHYFRIELAQRPESLKEFLFNVFKGEKINITDIMYSETHEERGSVVIGIELKDRHDYESLIERMKHHGIIYKSINNDRAVFDLLV